MSTPKLIAFYLPQFHCILENDEFWGKGFTDWVTVKKAKPLYSTHRQPRVPLNENYYDLSIEENVIWQSKLAIENGIDGFGVYHYWFNNEKNLLTKPAEIIRDCDEVKINYFLSWDNANWVRSWSNIKGNAWAPSEEKTLSHDMKSIMLVPYILGEKADWENHYQSVRLHFKSGKYITIEGKPVFMILNYSDQIHEMCDYWQELAQKDGFPGIFFIFKQKGTIEIPDVFYRFKYEPLYSGWPQRSFWGRVIRRLRRDFHMKEKVWTYNYDKIWNRILKNAEKDTMPNMFHGAFVSYDDSPRRGGKGTIVKKSTPEKFRQYYRNLYAITQKQGKDFIFLTAWNEWGEGAYLEPDTENKYEYLRSLKIK